MLSRKHRFHGRRSLAYVYRRGVTARVQHLAVRYARNPDQTVYRLAVIVSRKVHKSAVARNRLRRRIYEAVRTGPPIVEPYDLVITVFTDQVSALSHDELRASLLRLLTKAGVYRRQPLHTRAIVKPEDR